MKSPKKDEIIGPSEAGQSENETIDPSEAGQPENENAETTDRARAALHSLQCLQWFKLKM